MGRTDIGQTLEARRLSAFTYALMGTLTATDYLGDTSNDTGIPMPNCVVTDVHMNAETTSGSGTEITLENETSGNTVTFTPDTQGAVGTNDLEFNEGDELSIAVTSVDGATAGANVFLSLETELGTLV